MKKNNPGQEAEKSGSFFQNVLRISIPVSLQTMLQFSFAMVDQMMVGQLGSTAVAAVEVASRPAFIYSVILGAAASCTGIMVSQYMGMKNQRMADRSLSVNLAAALILAAVFMLPCLRFSGQIIGIYLKDDPEILEAGKAYLVWAAWTFIPMGMSSILSVYIRCMDQAIWPLYAGIASAAVNTGLNYVLIFGYFGFPGLGVTGAAIASIISQGVNVFFILAMFFRLRVYSPGIQGQKTDRPEKEKESFRFSLALGREGYRQFLWILFPVLFNEFLWGLGQNVNTIIYGHLNKGDLAAMSMTGPVQGLFIGALQGISQASGILIGKRLGAAEYDDAYQKAKKLMQYGFAASLALSAVLVFISRPYVLLYRVEADVQQRAAGLLCAFAVLAPVKVANMILGGGIIRSGGNTTYTMIIDLIGTWLVGVPLGLITAFIFRLPVIWVYFILSQEEVVRLLLTFLVFRRKTWMGQMNGGESL